MAHASRSEELASLQGDDGGDYSLPDFRKRFINDDDLVQFERALAAPEASPLVAINDWRPIRQRVRRPGGHRKATRRTKDETREGFVYALLKWPFLAIVLGWIIVLSLLYLLTRLYIYLFEHFVTWNGERQRLRRALRSSDNYEQWQQAAKVLDAHLGNDKWKDEDEYAYYDHATINRVTGQLKRLRMKAEQGSRGDGDNHGRSSALEELRILLEDCVKNNFVGVENPRLYSETYFGTKHLVQEFIDETHASLQLLLNSDRSE